MYAIIRTGGHQEKVVVGDQITVDRLKQEPGEEIRFVVLMMALDDGTVVSDHKELEGRAAVVGKVLEHIKGDKVDVFQYRQKSNYRRHTGHRQPLSLVEIAELRLGDTVELVEEKRAGEKAQQEALELTRQAEAEERKNAPKKVTPKKKTPAKSAAKATPKAAGGAKKAAAKKPSAAKGTTKKQG
jgi:large subunit ribosomal protein L21